MIKVTSDIFLNEDNDSKDESFFTEYKARLENLLKKHRDDILTIRTKIIIIICIILLET